MGVVSVLLFWIAYGAFFAINEYVSKHGWKAFFAEISIPTFCIIFCAVAYMFQMLYNNSMEMQVTPEEWITFLDRLEDEAKSEALQQKQTKEIEDDGKEI